jgi:hypothetical protein
LIDDLFNNPYFRIAAMSLNISAGECAVVLVNRRKLEGADLLFRLNVLEHIVTSLEIPLFSFEDVEFSNELFTELIRKVNVNNHPKYTPNLLIAGAYLENEATVSVLHALAEGFDVYCLTDLILALETKFTDTFNSRLIQAGAVPSTLRQIHYQWTTNESDMQRHSVLTKSLDAAV